MYTHLKFIIFSVCMLYVCQSYGQEIANKQCEKYVKELENIEKEEEILKVPRRLKRIVGGTKAKPSEFPFMVALGYGANDNIRWGCGGTLISEKFVLTGAKCASNFEGPVNIIRLGTTNLAVPIGQHPAQDITVKKVHIHPQFVPSNLYNDIALVELETNVNFSSSVFPACLQTDSRSIDVPVNAIGWGITEFSGEGSSDLMKVKLSISSPEVCRKAYPATITFRLKIDSDTQICAESPDRDTPRGTCQGDSGGPLHIQNGNKHIVVGVTSFGKACGIARSIGVYTKVSAFVPWLESIVWK